MRRSPVAEAAATAAMATRPSRRSVDAFMVSKRGMVVWACNTNQTLVVMVGGKRDTLLMCGALLWLMDYVMASVA